MQKDKKYAQAHNNLGIAYEKQNKYKESIECFQNAIEINPSIVKFHSKLGFIYVMRRDFANAKKAHNALIALGASKEAATLEKGINAYQGLQGY